MVTGKGGRERQQEQRRRSGVKGPLFQSGARKQSACQGYSAVAMDFTWWVAPYPPHTPKQKLRAMQLLWMIARIRHGPRALWHSSTTPILR